MKRVLYIVAIVSMFSISELIGQSRIIGEQSIYTHHFVNPVVLNPGAVGFDDTRELYLNFRNSWATFEGSPKTFSAGYNGALGNRLGFGASILSDSYASLETLKGGLSLSYNIDSKINKVGFGLSTEYVRHGLSGKDVNNPLIETGDEVIEQWLNGIQYFDLTFGIFGLYDKKLSYGFAFPSLISSRINSSNTSTSPESRDFSYIFNLGYLHEFSGYDFSLEPSIFVKQLIHVPFHIDINLKMNFLEERFTGGLTYTVGADKRIGLLLGTKISSLKFYYSYNSSTLDFQEYNNGSHEITLLYNIGNK